MFLSANAGKRSLGLSLRDPRGRDALLRLAARADVFLQSLRPGLAEELGLGPDAVRAANPRLVYCSLGAYGHTGPLAREARVRRADAGGRRAHLDHGRAGATRRPGRLVADRPGDGHVGGARRPRSAARARADGRGLRRRRLAVRDGDRLHRLPPGRLPRGRHDSERRGNPLPDGRPVPGDGRRGTASCWSRAATTASIDAICDVLGVPELVDDPRFRTNADRVRNRDELVPLLEARLRTDDSATWRERLGAAGVPTAPVADVRDVAESPQTAALGILQTARPPPDRRT